MSDATDHPGPAPKSAAPQAMPGSREFPPHGRPGPSKPTPPPASTRHYEFFGYF